MEDQLKCPICFEIPPNEIYQCTNGHTICRVCRAELIWCPQCRDPFGVKKIRTLALEQILDDYKFNCSYKEKGCSEKLKRQDLPNHAKICSFG